MFVISPEGTIARVGSVPSVRDVNMMASNLDNLAGVDARGQIVYPSTFRVSMLDSPDSKRAQHACSCRTKSTSWRAVCPPRREREANTICQGFAFQCRSNETFDGAPPSRTTRFV